MAKENKDLKGKAEDAFDSAKEKASEFAEEAKESTKKFTEEAKEKAGEFAEEAKETANEFATSAKEAFSGAGGDNKKVLAGILAIIFGSLGIHKFILGYQKEGIILLVATIIGFITACFIIGNFIIMATAIVGLIEGIIYLTKSDEDFYNTYQAGKKPWF